VLFLCTGNSARSIMAERLVERWGQGRCRGFSAGSRPKGEAHPLALEVLRRNKYLTERLRSRDWSEFSEPGAPQMDFVFTVCDNAAAEVCPVWPAIFVNLPFKSLDKLKLQQKLDEISHMLVGETETPES